ncbi:hypothetical protein NLN82_23375 [Citrobacter portucalensis]|uniref:hypothetical protein n=1 Tax=Citrobacter portucalensis TaxID=1639133 RepID=UPI00226BA8D8|nr:hypothetical protein [Citrobacter portucalensis]MCX9038970.1 hypothetical protein [Citrobacter portucalensis]
MNNRQIQARLVEQGGSYRQFALNNGYAPRTVTQAVARWAGKSELPRGRLTFKILRDLSSTIGEEIIPGILAHVE